MAGTRLFLEQQILRLQSQLEDLQNENRQYAEQYWAPTRPVQDVHTQIHQFDGKYVYTVERSIRGPTRLIFNIKADQALPSSNEEFLIIVRSAIHRADQTEGYTATGLTLGFVSARYRTTSISMPKRDIEREGWDWVLQNILDAENGRSFDIFDGYGDIVELMTMCALDFGMFIVHVSRKNEGGSGKSDVVFYEVKKSGPADDGDCLRRCVADSLHIGFYPDIMRDNIRIGRGFIGVWDIHKIENHNAKTIDVYEDVVDLVVSAVDKDTGRISDYTVHVDIEKPRLLHGKGSSDISLLLKDGHYSIIARKREPHEYMCKHTGRILARREAIGQGDKVTADIAGKDEQLPQA